MYRLVLVLALGLSVAATTVSVADARTPCRNVVYNDWYQDGQISSKYPISCYRDALRHLGTGDQVYTSLEDDIRAAMQAALARGHGSKVAAQVGHKFAKPVLGDPQQKTQQPSLKDEHPDTNDPATSPTNRKLASASVPVAAQSGGVPAPLLVLGGLALVLLAAGAVGTLVHRRR